MCIAIWDTRGLRSKGQPHTKGHHPPPSRAPEATHSSSATIYSVALHTHVVYLQ